MITCDKLCKTYKGEPHPAINNISLNVSANTVFGFLGPNGAGKTTTIKILTGLMRPDSGEVKIAKQIVSVDSVDVKQDVGYLGQEPKMYPWMKCRELLLFVGKLFGLDQSERKTRADNLLQMAGLAHAADKKISALSGGMLQRLGIAQALMGNPKVLFLDEPTSALDPIGRKEVLDFIAQIKEKCTVFMSTHILSDVERVCDTVAIINKGEIVLQENINSLKSRFAEKIVEIETVNSEEQTRLMNILKLNKSLNILKSENSKIIIHPENLEKEKQILLGIIKDHNIDIVKFQLQNPSLEDVFVKLVGGAQDEN